MVAGRGSRAVLRGWHMLQSRGVPSAEVGVTMGSDPPVLDKDRDMIVDVGASLFPDCEFVGLLRKGLEDRLVQRLEEFAAGTAEVFHQSCVELVEQLTDGLVQAGEAEERMIAYE